VRPRNLGAANLVKQFDQERASTLTFQLLTIGNELFFVKR